MTRPSKKSDALGVTVSKPAPSATGQVLKDLVKWEAEKGTGGNAIWRGYSEDRTQTATVSYLPITENKAKQGVCPTYYSYRNGKYYGQSTDLKEAKQRCIDCRPPPPAAVLDELPSGVPAVLNADGRAPRKGKVEPAPAPAPAKAPAPAPKANSASAKAARAAPVLTCQCGKVLSEADPCPLPGGKPCPLLPTGGPKAKAPAPAPAKAKAPPKATPAPAKAKAPAPASTPARKGKVPPPAAAPAPTSAPPARTRLDQGATITVLDRRNPRRPGTVQFDRYEVIIKFDGRPVSEFLAGGGDGQALTYAIKTGHAKL